MLCLHQQKLCITNNNLGSVLPLIQGYRRFSAENGDPTPIPSNFGVFRLDYIANVGAPKTKDPKLIIRAITFGLTQTI